MKNIFDQTVTQFNLVLEPSHIIGETLLKENNVIRPSVAFDIAIKAITYYLEEGVPEFIDHKEAWHETVKQLEFLMEDVEGTRIDTAYAMKLEPFEWTTPDIFALYGRIIAKFKSNYTSYINNRNSDSFGDLTVAECLKLLFNPFRDNLATASPWHYGPWKSRDPKVSRMWKTWPWADYYFSTIRETYSSLEDALGQNIPSGTFPYSVG